MPRTSPSSFRVGKVQGYCRGSVWYLCYHEHGKRRRPRVGPDRAAAKALAAQVNGQLESGAPAATSFEQVAVTELRRRWLEYHEQVLRSSNATVGRYRTATDHLLRFLDKRPVRSASLFQAAHAEELVRYLRTIRVSPNGHPNTAARPLMDKGVRYVLECCRSLFNFAAKRRHLPPYAENPFRVLEIDRIPVENTRPIELFYSEQERAFLEACDDWQFPLFLTLMLTGVRPGELCHLLLPDDLDLGNGVLRIRNKPKLGWKTKSRNERDIPLHPVLAAILVSHVGSRQSGPVFRRRRFAEPTDGWPSSPSVAEIEREMLRRTQAEEQATQSPLSAKQSDALARRLWNGLGALREERVRLEFMRLTSKIGLPERTAPKVLRHMFATTLQEGRVDPLIRNELMGHAAAGERTAGHGLGMTAVYTHTRPETKRGQLLEALASRAAVTVAIERLRLPVPVSGDWSGSGTPADAAATA